MTTLSITDQLEAAVTALRKYGQHVDQGSKGIQCRYPLSRCICGLNDALAAAGHEEPKAWSDD